MTSKIIATLSLLFFSIIGLLICLHFNGYAHSGDSLQHYLIAKEAPFDTELFFNHWGKPLYTLFMSPFAQFGFKGVKIGNLLLALLSGYYLFLSAQSLNKKHPYLTIIILFSMTLWSVKIFSGLTEYLSATMLIAAVYYSISKKHNLAAVIMSFLPFVRSEGLMLILGFVVFFIFHKKYKALALLSVGHLIYSMIGSFWYDDILWVFTKIPYAKLNTIYGKGTIIHFVEQMNYILSLPLYIILIIGLLHFVRSLVKEKNINELFSINTLLIYGLFLGFFIAHTLFWALAIFGSMGLNRVFITVLPLASLIILDGINYIDDYIKNKRVKTYFIVLISIFMVAFQFTDNPSTLNFPEDFKLKTNQQLLAQKVELLNLKSQTCYAADPYINYLTNSHPLNNLLNSKKINASNYLIWDDWYSPLEMNLTLEKLHSLHTLRKVFEIKNPDGTPQYIGFIKE